MRNRVSLNGDGRRSRKGPGEFVSPGFLVLCLLFCLAGTAAASEMDFLSASDGQGVGLHQPLFRILYAAGSRGALHPCPS